MVGEHGLGVVSAPWTTQQSLSHAWSRYGYMRVRDIKHQDEEIQNEICPGSGCKNQLCTVLCLLTLEMNRWPVCFKLFYTPPHEFRFWTNQEEGKKGDPGDLVGRDSTRVLTQSDDG